MERMFTSTDDDGEGDFSYTSTMTATERPVCAASLCWCRILGHAKLRKHFRNLLNICHTAKCWIVHAG